MSSKNSQIVRAIYDAFAAGDIPAVLARMSPDIVWNEADNFPYADGNPYIGPEAVLNGVFARCASQWDGFAVEIDELLDAGDTVVALGRYQGTYKQSHRQPPAHPDRPHLAPRRRQSHPLPAARRHAPCRAGHRRRVSASAPNTTSCRHDSLQTAHMSRDSSQSQRRLIAPGSPADINPTREITAMPKEHKSPTKNKPEHPEHTDKSIKENAANPQQPTKPAPKKNPVGVDHNPSQGGPSTRKNPEAGKEY